jgi:hypothetical protein
MAKIKEKINLKIERKKSLAISFKNGAIVNDEGRLLIQELDKDGCIIDENDLMEIFNSLVGEEGLQIKISKTDDIE